MFMNLETVYCLLYSSIWMLHFSTALEKGSYRIQTGRLKGVNRWDGCLMKVRKPQETLHGFSNLFCLPVEGNRETTAFRMLDRAVLSTFFLPANLHSSDVVIFWQLSALLLELDDNINCTLCSALSLICVMFGSCLSLKIWNILHLTLLKWYKLYLY